MRHIKGSRVKSWIENDGETGWIEPSFKQNTNNNDADKDYCFDDEKKFKERIYFYQNSYIQRAIPLNLRHY